MRYIHRGYSKENEKHFQFSDCKHGYWGFSCFTVHHANRGKRFGGLKNLELHVTSFPINCVFFVDYEVLTTNL